MVIAVAGCTHEGVGRPAAESASTTPTTIPPAARTTPSEAFGWINGRCVPSTLAGSPQRPPPPLVARSGSDTWYGVDDLWAVVNPDNVAARQPDGRAGMKSVGGGYAMASCASGPSGSTAEARRRRTFPTATARMASNPPVSTSPRTAAGGSSARWVTPRCPSSSSSPRTGVRRRLKAVGPCGGVGRWARLWTSRVRRCAGRGRAGCVRGCGWCGRAVRPRCIAVPWRWCIPPRRRPCPGTTRR
jgi:hypothetical protein